MQLSGRFTEKTLRVMHEMHFFTPKCLLSDQQDCKITDIENLSSFYKVDCAALAREFTSFRPLYREMHLLVNVTDLLPNSNKTGLSAHLTTDNDTDDESESDEVKTNTWGRYEFYQTAASYY